MGFKQVSSLDADVTVPLGGTDRKTGKKNPNMVEGYYLGSRQVDSKKSKTGKALIHFFQTSEGNLGVWGKTDLDRKLQGVPTGSMVRASHVGMQNTPNGEMYKYKVEVDGDNTIEVFNTAPPAESEEYESENEDEEQEVSEDEIEEAPPAFSKSSRDRVQALLSKNKKA